VVAARVSGRIRAAVILSAAECCKEPHTVFEFINGDRKHLIVNLNLFEETTTIIILISIILITIIIIIIHFSLLFFEHERVCDLAADVHGRVLARRFS
jgi:subtilase family serine protease